MKKILSLLLLGALCFGCSKDMENEPTTATLYGSVSDKTTGIPVAAAVVKLSVADGYGSLQAAAVTGTDGSFSFPELDPEQLYAIEVAHTEYKPFFQRIRVAAGTKNEISILIEPK